MATLAAACRLAGDLAEVVGPAAAVVPSAAVAILAPALTAVTVVVVVGRGAACVGCPTPTAEVLASLLLCCDGSQSAFAQKRFGVCEWEDACGPKSLNSSHQQPPRRGIQVPTHLGLICLC